MDERQYNEEERIGRRVISFKKPDVTLKTLTELKSELIEQEKQLRQQQIETIEGLIRHGLRNKEASVKFPLEYDSSKKTYSKFSSLNLQEQEIAFGKYLEGVLGVQIINVLYSDVIRGLRPIIEAGLKDSEAVEKSKAIFNAINKS